MIGKLIWKEWSEQRWKLFLGCVLLGGFTAIGLQARLAQDLLIMDAALVYALIFPLFASMDVVAADRADGTLKSLLSLPVPAWKVLTVKAAVGLICCIGPLALTAALACIVAGGREAKTDDILWVYAGCACLTAAAFIWTLSFGVGQPTEARAAIAGLLAFGIWLLPLPLYMILGPYMSEWVMVIHPFSLMVLMDSNGRDLLGYIIPVLILVQAALAAWLFVWAARQLAREGRAA